MAVGRPVTKIDIDSRCGQLAVDFLAWVARVQAIVSRLAGTTDAQLTALGYDAADITALRAFLTDQNQLKNISIGNATLGTAKDFRTNAQPLTGLD